MLKEIVKFVVGLVCMLIVLAFLALVFGCAADNQIGVNPLKGAKVAETIGIGDKGRDITKDSPVNTGTQITLPDGNGWEVAVIILAAVLLVVSVLALRAHVARLREHLDRVESERDKLAGYVERMKERV